MFLLLLFLLTIVIIQISLSDSVNMEKQDTTLQNTGYILPLQNEVGIIHKIKW